MRLPLVMAVALSAGIAASAASSSGRDTNMAANGSRQSACADYIVIDSRGSGEAGGLSKPGSIFYPYFKADVLRRNPSARVAVIPNGYPAWGSIPTMISALAKLPQQYYKSVVEGKKWLSTQVGVLLVNCPGSKFVLTGYSQGAQVTGDFYQNTSSTEVIGVALFGDPKFNSADPAARGGTSGLDGALGTRALFSSEPGKESIGHVLSYCHDRDPVCQGVSRLRYGSAYHHYYAEPEGAAQYLARFVPRTGGSGGHAIQVRLEVGSQEVALDGASLTHKGITHYREGWPLLLRKLGNPASCSTVASDPYRAVATWPLLGVQATFGQLGPNVACRTDAVLLALRVTSPKLAVVTERGTLHVGDRFPLPPRLLQGAHIFGGHGGGHWFWPAEDVCARLSGAAPRADASGYPYRLSAEYGPEKQAISALEVVTGVIEVTCP